jgi:L-histidine Nalpha-methyltransferase
MQIAVQRELGPFALDVIEGLSKNEKSLPPRYFYDDLGSALFQAITMLPEYGLTRADERVLERHAPSVAAQLRPPFVIAELGSGDGSKTSHLLRAASVHGEPLTYFPIDISAAALEVCQRELEPLADVRPVLADYFTGLRQVREQRAERDQLLVLFLGSTIGNFDREAIPEFLATVRGFLKTGDLFLLGADLVKPEQVLLDAYDDPLGVTAAFNLNLLRRINTELGGNFNLRAFRHQALWNPEQRRIEIHLVSSVEQVVSIENLQVAIPFREGETIWTESCHKFTVPELEAFGFEAGFEVAATWTDQEWPFAESIWRAR